MSCMAGSSADEEKSRDVIASTGHNCYSDASSNGNPNIQAHLVTHLQNFGPEIYNLSTAGMENMIGFPSKNPHHDQDGTVSWKGYFTNTKPGGPSSSREINLESGFYSQHDLTEMIVFPCEGNERPSHGLSLSLSSSNPSNIGLQTFELRQHHDDLFRFGPSSSRPVNNNTHDQQLACIKNSRYLGPAQELLSEFCNNLNDRNTNSKMKAIQKNNEGHEWQELYSLDLLELQRRKTKLLQMLEELDRRYKHYRDQMKAVVSSFEYAAGNAAATSYSASASRAMSRHFRCLKDGILSQVKATKKAMGEKDTAVAGTVKGETPRLRLIDQTLRQQRALQQMDNIHPWRPQRGLPERSVSVLRAWLFEHFLHPYPSDVDKHILARQTGLSRSQVSNWFINARVRLWKPMVEEMYLEELKDEDQAPNDAASSDDDGLKNHNPSDQKPTHDQLVRIDSECLSSIINNPDKNDAGKNKALQNHNDHQNPSFVRLSAAGDSFGAMGFDFSSYGSSHSVGGGGVSLTLGLHQHSGSGDGMNLPFSQSSLFYPRDHQIEDCQTVEYSLLDGESQNLPYRNLMGAQLLHDLAG